MGKIFGDQIGEEKNILLFGVPRSGTTWLAKILMAGGELASIHEPDNERHTYSAYYYKRGLPRFPYISSPNKTYFRLFYNALNKAYISNGSYSNELLFKLGRTTREKIESDFTIFGHNKLYKAYPEMLLYPVLPKQVKNDDKRRLVKSVHAVLSAEFILNQFNVEPVFIIRHPAGIVSSYLYLDSPDIDRNIYRNQQLMSDLFGTKIPEFSMLKTKEALGGFQVAIFYKMINQFIKKYPNIHLVIYEELAADPENISKELFEKVSLSWNSDVKRLIEETNKTGQGYETNRVASEQINIWEQRLTEYQVEEVKKGYSLVSPHYYKEFVNSGR